MNMLLILAMQWNLDFFPDHWFYWLQGDEKIVMENSEIPM